jgi:hypothetical protein
MFASFILAILIVVQPVMAQEAGEDPDQSWAEYQFGQVMRFGLNLDDHNGVEKVTLFFRTPDLPSTFSIDLDIYPVSDVATHDLDLTSFQLAPFTTVTYWWRTEDMVGNVETIHDKTIEYIDDRFEWNTLGEGDLVVHWTGDEVSIGQAALDVAGETLPELMEIYGAEPAEAMHLYVYPSVSDLRAALLLAGRDWIGAHGHPELGVILVSTANPRTAAVDLGQSIPHELSHLLMYWATGTGYESTPRWFDEGLASLFEDSPNSNYDALLSEAVAAGTTIPLSVLCRSFPSDADGAALAYAQSVSFVRALQAEYGNLVLGQMVRALADGADCQSMTERATGLSMGDMEQSWLEQLQPQSMITRFWRRGGVWLLLLLAGFVLMGAFLIIFPRSSNNEQE